MTDVTGVSWTPDGKIVYATNTGGKWEIWKIDADGANQKQLTQNCAGNDSCSQPMVSPDGRYIVFQALPHTLGLGPEVWRVLDKCHSIRNLGEYEGDLNVNERLVADLIAACHAVATKLNELAPILDAGSRP